jgi:hypothetical protein
LYLPIRRSLGKQVSGNAKEFWDTGGIGSFPSDRRFDGRIEAVIFWRVTKGFGYELSGN